MFFMRYACQKKKGRSGSCPKWLCSAVKGHFRMESIILRIYELMKEQGITQKRLADELQVSYSSLNNYLNGRRWLHLEHIRVLSRCLNTSSDYLLGLSDQTHPHHLPDDETALLEAYRTLPSHARHYAFNQMQQLAQLCRLLERQQ